MSPGGVFSPAPVAALNSGCCAFFSEYDSGDSTGTLTYFNGKTCEKIADDVYDYLLLEDGSVVYRTDVSSGRGTLKFFDGSSSKTVSEDASELVGVYSVSRYMLLIRLYLYRFYSYYL